MSPIPHKFKICKALKQKATPGPALRALWERVIQIANTESSIESYNFETLPRSVPKKKRAKTSTEKKQHKKRKLEKESDSYGDDVVVDSQPVTSSLSVDTTVSNKRSNRKISISHSYSSSKSHSSSQGPPRVQATVNRQLRDATNEIDREFEEMFADGVSRGASKYLDLAGEFSSPFRLGSQSFFSDTPKKSKMLESIPEHRHSPSPIQSCKCVTKNQIDGPSYSRYIDLSSPAPCLKCNLDSIEETTSNSSTFNRFDFLQESTVPEDVRLEFLKCQDAIGEMERKGYRLTPYINGKWMQDTVAEWRLVPKPIPNDPYFVSELPMSELTPIEQQRGCGSPLDLDHHHRISSFRSVNSLDQLLMAAGAVEDW